MVDFHGKIRKSHEKVDMKLGVAHMTQETSRSLIIQVAVHKVAADWTKAALSSIRSWQLQHVRHGRHVRHLVGG